MANFDSNVLTTVSADASPVGRAGFGFAIVCDDASMSERLLTFENVSAAQTSQTAGDITSAQLTAITAAFAQTPRPAKVGAGRTSFTDVAQVDTVTVGGTIADGDTFTVTINGTDFTYAAGAGEVIADVVAGLVTAINVGSEPVTAADASPDLTLTADVAGDPFDASVSATSSAGTIAIADTTANQSVATELAAITEQNDSWYAFALVSRAQKDIERAAEWVEARSKIYVAQSSESDILTTAATDVASALQDASYNRTALLYYSDDSEPADFAWLAKTLVTNLDEETTQWAYKTLATIPVDDDNVTSTEKANALAKSVNFYLTLGGVGSTSNGTMASGRFIDVTTTVDWVSARVTEEIQQALLDYSNRNSKLPYTDDGFQAVKGLVNKVLGIGVVAGHFERDPDIGSPTVTVPRRNAVSSANASARNLPYEFVALLSGGILTVQGTGTVSTNTATVALLAGVEEAI